MPAGTTFTWVDSTHVKTPDISSQTSVRPTPQRTNGLLRNVKRQNSRYPGISIGPMTMSQGTVTDGGAYTSKTMSTSAGFNATVASCL